MSVEIDLQLNFKRRIVMQWYQAYINYFILQQRLYRLHEIFDTLNQEIFAHGSQYTVLKQPTITQKQEIKALSSFINDLTKIGSEKFWGFYRYKKLQIIYDCQNLQDAMRELEMVEIITHNSCMQRFYLKTAIKLIYMNCHYLKIFLKLNVQIKEKIEKIMNEYLVMQTGSYIMNKSLEKDSLIIENKNSFLEDQIKSPKSSLIKKVRKNSVKSKQSIENEISEDIHTQIDFLTEIQDKTKQIYLQLVFFNQEKSNRLEELANFENKKNTPKTYLYVGLYSGMSAVSFLAIILLLAFGLVSPQYDQDNVDSMYYVFPLFRGVGLLILYLWGMAWNVYGFCKNRISFRRILGYGAHYSTHLIIIKRASFFTLIFCIMLLVYFVGATYNTTKQLGEDRFPIEYTPFIVWMLYLGYIFFPNRQIFNPNGRKYFYRVIKQVILSPIGKMTFLISWLTDQTVSFVVPIKDMSYTICFYMSDFSNNKITQIAQCQNKTAVTGFLVAYFIALIPLLLRMVQCYRQAIQDQKNNGKFIGHLQMWNFGKYCASVITSTIGYLSTIEDNFIVPLIISSIISTSYAYCWDLKYDWGFLEKSSKHRFLRNHLSYRQIKFYYIAIAINLIFRLSWTLSISPFVQKAITSPLVPLIIGLIEILRRCMWNFFRIEKQHIVNCRNYAATQNIQKLIGKIRVKDYGTTGENQQKIDNQSIFAESIPYFVRDSDEKFLTTKLIPGEQNNRLILSQEVTLLKDKFQLLVKKEEHYIGQKNKQSKHQ